jgi:hypothetical protein
LVDQFGFYAVLAIFQPYYGDWVTAMFELKKKELEFSWRPT